MTAVYASLVAQHENLGDVVLRRELVRWIAPCGPLHLLAPHCPDGYLAALDLPADAVLHRSSRDWYRSLLRDGAAGRAALVYSPGPQDLGLAPGPFFDESSRVALTAMLRARGNPVVKLGRSFENVHAVTRSVASVHARLLSTTVVRDERSAKVTPSTQVCPDLALGAFGDAVGTVDAGGVRRTLVVTSRATEESNLRRVADAARTVAGALDLVPVVVCQVEFDDEPTRALADLLGCERVALVPVAAGSVERAADVYSAAAAVLSDRLHALLFGVALGAVPLLAPSVVRPKLDASLATLGLDRLARTSPGLIDLPHARSQVAAAAKTARADLDATRAEVRSLLGGGVRVG